MRKRSLPIIVTLIALIGLAACGGGSTFEGDAETGKSIYSQNPLPDSGAPGCLTCHSLEPGKVVVGPSHANVAARASETVSDAAYQGSATSIEEYLQESILNPDAHVVDGYQPGMMFQKYAEELSDQEVADLVAFLATLD